MKKTELTKKNKLFAENAQNKRKILWRRFFLENHLSNCLLFKNNIKK